MGLLDGLDKMTPAQQGLLAMGLGMMGQRGTFGQAVSHGGMQGMAAMQQAQEAQRQKALEDMRMEQLQYQIGRSRAQDERERAYKAALGSIDPKNPQSLADVALKNGDIETFIALSKPKRDGVPTGFIDNGDGTIEPMKIAGGGNYMDYQVKLASEKSAQPGYGEQKRLQFAENADRRAADAATKEGLREVPTSQVDSQIGNISLLNQIDDALASTYARPDSFGIKTYQPNDLLQVTDPDGISHRAKVAELAAAKVNDLSGAAVSVSEYERLKPFLPKTGDSAEAVRKKLINMRNHIKQLTQSRSDFFSNGYRKPMPTYSPKESDGDLRPGSIQHGHMYTGGDPKLPESWVEL